MLLGQGLTNSESRNLLLNNTLSWEHNVNLSVSVYKMTLSPQTDHRRKHWALDSISENENPQPFV